MKRDDIVYGLWQIQKIMALAEYRDWADWCERAAKSLSEDKNKLEEEQK